MKTTSDNAHPQRRLPIPQWTSTRPLPASSPVTQESERTASPPRSYGTSRPARPAPPEHVRTRGPAAGHQVNKTVPLPTPKTGPWHPLQELLTHTTAIVDPPITPTLGELFTTASTTTDWLLFAQLAGMVDARRRASTAW